MTALLIGSFQLECKLKTLRFRSREIYSVGESQKSLEKANNVDLEILKSNLPVNRKKACLKFELQTGYQIPMADTHQRLKYRLKSITIDWSNQMAGSENTNCSQMQSTRRENKKVIVNAQNWVGFGRWQPMCNLDAIYIYLH